MISDADFKRLMDWTQDIELRLRRIEDNSRLAANTEQPLVRPPVESTENLPRSPDRDTFTKLKAFIEIQVELGKHIPKDNALAQAKLELAKRTLAYAESLDRGDEHKCFPEVEQFLIGKLVKQAVSEV